MTAKFLESVVGSVSSSEDARIAMKLVFEAFDTDVISRDRYYAYRCILEGVLYRSELFSSPESL